MCNLPWLNACQPHAHLIFGCQKGHMIYFAMVVNFFSSNWELKHINIGLFQANDTSGATTVMKLKQVLDKFSFTRNIVAYVKDEGFNLQTCVMAFNSIVSCDGLGMT
jgi:hypothetical protein